MMQRLVSAAVFSSTVCSPGSRASAELFHDGETVCFLGDSITAGGRCPAIIADDYDN